MSDKAALISDNLSLRPEIEEDVKDEMPKSEQIDSKEDIDDMQLDKVDSRPPFWDIPRAVANVLPDGMREDPAPQAAVAPVAAVRREDKPDVN